MRKSRSPVRSPGDFDSKMQQTGILLEVPSVADVKILKRASGGCLVCSR